MSTELERTVEDSLVARAGVHALLDAAEQAETPHEAREVMLKGRLVSDLLQRARAPFEEARIAGKASVVAARKLGRLIAATDPTPRRKDEVRPNGLFNGMLPSERGELIDELRLSRANSSNLIRLAGVEDPAFQRYIQDESLIPSMNGALRACSSGYNAARGHKSNNWRASRRAKAGVRTPKNPSLEEAHSLIVRSLGHLAATAGGSPKKRTAIASAIDLLYQAEDLLRPLTGGYVK